MGYLHTPIRGRQYPDENASPDVASDLGILANALDTAPLLRRVFSQRAPRRRLPEIVIWSKVIRRKRTTVTSGMTLEACGFRRPLASCRSVQ